MELASSSSNRANITSVSRAGASSPANHASSPISPPVRSRSSTRPKACNTLRARYSITLPIVLVVMGAASAASVFGSLIGWRDMKGALGLRPVFHDREDRIRAHV